jgi:hypothetical protein
MIQLTQKLEQEGRISKRHGQLPRNVAGADSERETVKGEQMKTFSLAGKARAKFILMREHSSQHGVGDVQGREKGPGESGQGQVEKW